MGHPHSPLRKGIRYLPDLRLVFQCLGPHIFLGCFVRRGGQIEGDVSYSIFIGSGREAHVVSKYDKERGLVWCDLGSSFALGGWIGGGGVQPGPTLCCLRGRMSS